MRIARTIGFRILFAYLTLYLLLCRIVESDLGLAANTGVAPGGKLVLAAYAKIWAPVVVWTGRHCLRWAKPIRFRPGGNSDGVFGYTQIFVFAVLAVIGAFVWTIFERRGERDRALHEALRVWLRYALAFSMLSYGMIKVIPVQFYGLPSLGGLMIPYGRFSPFLVLWNFMGYSKAYTCFAGSVEVLGGALLLFRRTATLGALVSGAALLNVGMLDFCYQVPEKLDVMHLFLMVVVLIAPDAKRLANVFLLNRSAKAELPGWESPVRARVGRSVLKTAVIIYMAGSTLLMAVELPKSYGPRSPVYGIYDVDEFVRNGEAVPPLATDAVRWRRVVFEDASSALVEHMDESWQECDTEYNAADKSITFEDGKRKSKDVMAYSQPDAGRLVLRGKLGDGSVEVRLKKFDESKLPLIGSRFRWVNGVP